jgi:hypothetical protein
MAMEVARVSLLDLSAGHLTNHIKNCLLPGVCACATLAR